MASETREILLKIRELEHKMNEVKTRAELFALDAEIRRLLEELQDKLEAAGKITPRSKPS